jgi:acyltransferase
LSHRLNYIDYMKGIGILMVILGHMSELPNSIRIYIYSCHMPLFFFISGYLFNSNKNREFIPFLRKKTFSLLLPYVYLQLLLLLFYSAADIFSESSHNFIEHLSTILYGNVLYQTNYINTPWFLICLFTVDLIFQRITILTKNNLKFIFLIALISSLIGYSLSLLDLVRLPYTLDVTFTAITFYSFGYIFKYTNIIHKLKVRITMFTLLIINIIFLILNNLWATNSLLVDGRVDMIYLKYGNYFFFYIAALAGIIFIYYFANQLSKKISILNYLGQNSLVIMVFHIPVYIVLGKTFELLHFTRNNIVILVLKFILILIITSLIITIINKFFPFVVGKNKVKKYKNTRISA